MYSAWTDLRQIAHDRFAFGGVSPGAPAAPTAPTGVVAWSCTDGYLVFLACSISERLLGVTGSIGWHGSISLVVPVP